MVLVHTPYVFFRKLGLESLLLQQARDKHQIFLGRKALKVRVQVCASNSSFIEALCLRFWTMSNGDQVRLGEIVRLSRLEKDIEKLEKEGLLGGLLFLVKESQNVLESVK